MCIAFRTNNGDKNTLIFVNFQSIKGKMKKHTKNQEEMTHNLW